MNRFRVVLRADYGSTTWTYSLRAEDETEAGRMAQAMWIMEFGNAGRLPAVESVTRL
jgi:hypothetical protein